MRMPIITRGAVLCACLGAHYRRFAGYLLAGVLLVGLALAARVFTANLTTISAGDLTVTLDSTGAVTGLMGPDGMEHNIAAQSTSLISLVVEASPATAVSSGTAPHYKPTGMSYNAGTAAAGETARGEYTFSFADNISVTVLALEKRGYATLEVAAIANPDDKDIRLLLWGPLTTDITEHVADTVGVVSNRDFAIGLLGANARTLGGWPQDYPQSGFAAVAPGAGSAPARSCRAGFAVCGAAPTAFGSILQAYTRDYGVARVFDPWSAGGATTPLPVAPLTGELAGQGQLVGSKVVLFGVARRGAVTGNRSLRDILDAEVLARLGAIEVGEGLPHPVLAGVWGKRSERAGAPYLVFTDLAGGNLDRALTLANDLGWQTVYRNSGWGAFAGGDLGVSPDFGGNDAGLRAAAERASARRVGLGSHSLFGTIPASLATRHVADLLVTHYAILDAELTATAASLRLRPYPGTTAAALPRGFGDGAGTVRIGAELIAYRRVSAAPDGGLVLAGLQRGHEDSRAATHAAGTRVGRLGEAPGQAGYLAGLRLLHELLAPRLADRLNQGVSTFTFGGSHRLTWDGYGALGQNLVMAKVFDELADKTDVIHAAANALPFTWHLNARYDRGGTAAAVSRARASYRRADQVYFRRNYLPASLGWFDIDNANEWRWALARAAAFDAGFAYYGEVADAGRYHAALRAEIRNWRNAQLAGTFDWPNRFVMQARDDYFKLDKVVYPRAFGPTWKLSDWAKSGDSGAPAATAAPWRRNCAAFR